MSAPDFRKINTNVEFKRTKLPHPSPQFLFPFPEVTEITRLACIFPIPLSMN